MNKNFAFLTSVPPIPEIPDDFENNDDKFCWIIYQMKELNLLLDAYASNKLVHITKKLFSTYFQNIRDILISLVRKGHDSLSSSTIESLRETFSHTNELVSKVSAMRTLY